MRRTVITALLIFVGIWQAGAQKFNLYIGTYTGSGSKGIYIYEFDATTGQLTFLNTSDTASNPSYLALSKDENYLYSVNETGGERPGSVSAYRIDKSNSTLKYLNSEPTGGDAPCYISLHPTGKIAAVANYSGGSASVFPIRDDGMIDHRVQLMQDTGSGANANRQNKPHVHSAVFSPDGEYLFTPDLGTDKVMIYKVNADNTSNPLQAAEPAFAASTSGNGPRHFTFSPDGNHAYVINELSGVVTVFKYDDGELKKKQEIAAHPKGFKGVIGSADIHVSPDGNFLYASNRGDENNIAIFSIGKNGKLKSMGYESTRGKTPRNFVIDPSGKYLLVANQETGDVVEFKRDLSSGKLIATGVRLEIPKPVCLKFGNEK